MLATDTPTTLLAVAMTHYELPGLGLDGRNVDLVQIDAPFRSYLTSARALLRARSLEGLVGNWDRSDGLPPVLRTVAEIISHSWMDATCSSTSAGKRIF